MRSSESDIEVVQVVESSVTLQAQVSIPDASGSQRTFECKVSFDSNIVTSGGRSMIR